MQGVASEFLNEPMKPIVIKFSVRIPTRRNDSLVPR